MKYLGWILFIVAVFVACYFYFNPKISYVEKPPVVKFIPGDTIISTKWVTKHGIDTQFVVDTASFSLFANFSLEADSALCTGRLEYLDSLGVFRFSEVAIRYPEKTLKITDTVKITNEKIVEKPIKGRNWLELIGAYALGLGSGYIIK